jgi:hypothetical protein
MFGGGEGRSALDRQPSAIAPANTHAAEIRRDTGGRHRACFPVPSCGSLVSLVVLMATLKDQEPPS